MNKIRKCFPRPKAAPDGRIPVDHAFGLFLENAPPEESMVPLTKVEAKSTIQPLIPRPGCYEIDPDTLWDQVNIMT